MSAQDLLCMSMIASMNKHLPVLLVLLGFGLVGCATTTDGKLVTFFGLASLGEAG